MLELSSSPNITRFAMMHGVLRQSVVDNLISLFGNHQDLLELSSAHVDVNGVLHLKQNDSEIVLDVRVITLPILTNTLEDVWGVLQPVKPDAQKFFALVIDKVPVASASETD